MRRLNTAPMMVYAMSRAFDFTVYNDYFFNFKCKYCLLNVHKPYSYAGFFVNAVSPLVPCRVFITTLNIPFIGVAERLLLFSLSGLSGNVLNRHALPGVDHDAVRQRRHFRHIQNAHKIVMNVKLLRPAFPHALRLMHNYLFHKLIHDNRGSSMGLR